MATSSRPGREPAKSAEASPTGRPAPRSGSKKKKTAKAGGAPQTAPGKKTSRRMVKPASETALSSPVASPEALCAPVDAETERPEPEAPIVTALRETDPPAQAFAQASGRTTRPTPAETGPQGEQTPPASPMPSAPVQTIPDAERLPAAGTTPPPAASDSDAAVAPSASPQAEGKTSTSPHPVSDQSPSPEATPPAQAPVRAPYDVTGFLIGVFEGLPGSTDLSLDCAVDPRADTVAVERLLYFSQALQLLFSAFRSPDTDTRRPAEKTAPQRLHIRLDLGPGERIGLRLYDDGHFFAQLLPRLHWDDEALRPLCLFVSRKGGSLCLRRGRCVEFEIIG